MMTAVTILISGLSTAICIYILYLYVRKSGSKLDYMKANLLLQEEQLIAAEALFRTAINKTKQTDTIHLSSLMGLYNIYQKQNKKEEAANILENAIQLSETKREWYQFNKQLLNIKKKDTSVTKFSLRPKDGQ